MKTFMFYAMGRTGSHSVINWMCKNYPGRIVHYNNCVRGWEKKKFLPWANVQKKYGQPPWEAQVLNIEWFDPDDYDEWKFWEFEPWRMGHEIVHVLLMRDPFNWLASSLQIGNKDIEAAIAIYKKQAQVAFTEILSEKDPNGLVRPVIINYNRWFSDMMYRDSIATRLRLRTTDEGTAGASRFGGGPTFQTFKEVDGQTWKLGTLERWKFFINNIRYRELMDYDLAEFSSWFFGFCPMRITP